MTIILWTHPRSVSTAFERTVAERGDIEILHEPFSDLYYGFDKKATAVSYAPQLDFEPSYTNIKKFILNQSNHSEKLFIKDMAYHGYQYLKNDFDWMKSFVPVFLIRHPEKSIPSNYKLNSAVTSEEIGYDSLYEVYQLYLKNKIQPLVIDAADFTSQPKKVLAKFCDYCNLEFDEKSLQWKKEAPKAWKTWEAWHKDAANAKGIEVKNTKYEHDIHNHPTLKAFYEYHIDYYQKLLNNKSKI